MQNKHRTAKGRPIDWEALRRQNENSIALGNAKMNARGDILSKGGKVVKTREQIEEEYNKFNPNAVQQVSIKEPIVKEPTAKSTKIENPKNIPEEFITPKEAVNRLTKKAPSKKRKQTTPPSRKIIEE